MPYTFNLICNGFWNIDEGGVRSFLIEGLDRALLVDTGFGRGDIKTFAGQLTKLPVFLVNTHGDPDHVGCNSSFDKVLMHPDEIGYLKLKRPDLQMDIEPIVEGDVIDLGNRQLEVVHIPGHTPGSIALLDKHNKLAICGDSVQNGAIYMFGVGRDISLYIESMIKLNQLLADFEMLLPSHGDLPLKPDIIADLIEGAKQVINGKVKGFTPPRSMPCELYEVGRAKFLYRIEEQHD